MKNKPNKSDVFIDLSKCSEEQRKHIFSLLPKCINEEDYMIFDSFYNLHSDKGRWYCGSSWFSIVKTELQYPEFIKLFEGGEGENNGWIKIESESDLPKEDINCWWMDKKDGMILGKFLIENNNGDIDFILENATHYQPIIKPKPPKI